MASGESLLQRLDKPAIPWSVVIRVFLGAYFIQSGYNKAAADPQAFLKAIHLYDMFPVSPGIYMNSAAIILPWLEIVCGAALVLGLFRRGAAVVIGLMLAGFTPAILLRALEVMREEGILFFTVAFDCGCGTGNDIIWIKLSQNTGLFLLALCAVFSRSTRYSVAGLLDRRKPPVARCHERGAAKAVGAAETCEEPSGAGATRSPETAT